MDSDIDLLLVSSTDHPRTINRRAHEFFMPLAEELQAKHGVKARVVAPWEGEPPKLGLSYTHADPFLREARIAKPKVVAFWTSKPAERYAAKHLREVGITTLFSELGWFPHGGSFYFDPKGCGARSSLVDYEPPESPAIFSLPQANNAGPMGVILQMENDLAIQESQFGCNGDFVACLLQQWPGRELLIRPHPGQPKVALPVSPNLKPAIGGSLEGFFKRCGPVVGMNSTALIEALAAGKLTYMLSPGIGFESGAVLTDCTPPEQITSARRATINAKAEDLVYDLRHRRQIAMTDEGWVDTNDLNKNVVLWEALGRGDGGASRDNDEGREIALHHPEQTGCC